MAHFLTHGHRRRTHTIRFYYAALLVLFALLTFLPLSWFPSFYDTRYMGLISLLGIAIVFWISWMFSVPETAPHAEQKNAAVHRAQYLLTLYIFASVVGDLGLYQLYRVGFQYDKVLHFAIPFVTMVMVPALAMVRFDISFARAASYTFAGLMLVGVLWEVYEFTVDLLFGTRLFGIYRMSASWDTQMDVLCVALGTVAGLPFARWYQRHMSS